MRKSLSLGCITVFSFILISNQRIGAEDVYLKQGASSATGVESKITGRENIFKLQGASQFQTPKELRHQVNFWKKIFTGYSTRQCVIHDNRVMDVVYEAIDLTEDESKDKKLRSLAISPALNKYRAILERLDTLSQDELQNLTGEDKRVYELLYSNGIRKGYKDAAGRLRVQVGQSDRFKKALSRSTLYIKDIEEIFAMNNLPIELTRLPFVESAFDINAYSWAKAAGLWQFTRCTAKKYMRMDKFVDERLDPVKSTMAAAKLLSYNYSKLSSWPLAVTAYNHGCYGMQKAVEKTSTRDIGFIVENYDGPAFGFASRNFYTELLAVLEILDEYDKYFSDIVFQYPESYDTVKILKPVKLSRLISATSVTVSDIQRLNPELLNSVLVSKIALPQNYSLKIPQGTKEILISALEADIEKADEQPATANLTVKTEVTEKSVKTTEIPPSREKAQASKKPSETVQKTAATAAFKEHVIQKGQTLYSLARFYNIPLSEIMKINSLTNPETIKIGQVLKIPGQT
ncbi:MAG: transglycosylase SLT domain-containing protein [Nitrospirae bacterium YQR-1]